MPTEHEKGENLENGARVGLNKALEIAEARLADARPDLPLEFTFRWQDMRHLVRVEASTGGAELTLATAIRKLPYSSEDDDTRRLLQALVDPPLRLTGGRFTLSENQRIVYAADTHLAAPVTNGEIIIGAIRLLLEARACHLIARDPALIRDVI